MRTLDEKEKRMVTELIRNPRISDNQISKRTHIPVKTVNIKRKKLEKENLLSYFCYLNTAQDGTGHFTSRHLYIVLFKSGITKKLLIDKCQQMITQHNIKHILDLNIAEQNGKAVLLLVIESRLGSDIAEIFNADMVPELNRLYGEQCIESVLSLSINKQVRLLHNYLPGVNMVDGKIRDDWKNDMIFVDE